MSLNRIVTVVLAVLGVGLLAWWCSPPSVTPPVGPAGVGTEGGDVPPGQAGEDGPRHLTLAVVGTLDDRLVQEPCNRIVGGGIFTIAQFLRESSLNNETLGVFMGNATNAYGEFGRQMADRYYDDMLRKMPFSVCAAGTGELALGSEYVRTRLRSIQEAEKFSFLCANAVDSTGQPVLRGWLLAAKPARTLLFVSVVSQRFQGALIDRGSDIELVDPSAAVAQATRDARERAQGARVGIDLSVLLVHGTVEEARALLRANPGFDLAVAADGPVLPDPEPLFEGDVPIVYTGKGARFAAYVHSTGVAGDALDPDIVRLGVAMRGQNSTPGPLRGLMAQTAPHLFSRVLETDGSRPPAAAGGYVGVERCLDCHEAEVTAHRLSPHARAPKALLDSYFAASASCLGCHVTAPWNDGGYSGPITGDERAGVSCEACHGPGGEHSDLPEPGWGKVEMDRCLTCHLPERSPGFDPRAAWDKWGHGAVAPDEKADEDEDEND